MTNRKTSRVARSTQFSNDSGVDVAKKAQKILIWLLSGNGTKVKIILFLTIVQGTKVKNV